MSSGKPPPDETLPRGSLVDDSEESSIRRRISDCRPRSRSSAAPLPAWRLEQVPSEAGLVLMDLKHAGNEGLEATRRLKSNPTAAVIILTLHDNPEYRARRGGAGRWLCPRRSWGCNCCR